MDHVYTVSVDGQTEGGRTLNSIRKAFKTGAFFYCYKKKTIAFFVSSCTNLYFLYELLWDSAIVDLFL